MKKSRDVSLKFAISFSDKFLQTFVEILSFQALFYCQSLSFLLYRSLFFELFFGVVCYYKVFHSISNKRFKEKKHFFRLDVENAPPMFVIFARMLCICYCKTILGSLLFNHFLKINKFCHFVAIHQQSY